ncbi:MAG: hypothetical protein EBU84_18300, partial [Actinobacteria bacterium]|nr:hypothetical protein [Actinomycetota bacterium]
KVGDATQFLFFTGNKRAVNKRIASFHGFDGFFEITGVCVIVILATGGKTGKFWEIKFKPFAKHIKDNGFMIDAFIEKRLKRVIVDFFGKNKREPVAYKIIVDKIVKFCGGDVRIFFCFHACFQTQ